MALLGRGRRKGVPQVPEGPRPGALAEDVANNKCVEANPISCNAWKDQVFCPLTGACHPRDECHNCRFTDFTSSLIQIANHDFEDGLNSWASAGFF